MQDETCAGQFGHLTPVGWHGGCFGFVVRDNGSRDCVLTYNGARCGVALDWVTRALEAASDPATAARWPSEVAFAWRVAAGIAQAEGAHREARAFMAQADAWAGLCAKAP